jgi:predicted metal-binding protein
MLHVIRSRWVFRTLIRLHTAREKNSANLCISESFRKFYQRAVGVDSWNLFNERSQMSYRFTHPATLSICAILMYILLKGQQRKKVFCIRRKDF